MLQSGSDQVFVGDETMPHETRLRADLSHDERPEQAIQPEGLRRPDKISVEHYRIRRRALDDAEAKAIHAQRALAFSHDVALKRSTSRGRTLRFFTLFFTGLTLLLLLEVARGSWNSSKVALLAWVLPIAAITFRTAAYKIEYKVLARQAALLIGDDGKAAAFRDWLSSALALGRSAGGRLSDLLVMRSKASLDLEMYGFECRGRKFPSSAGSRFRSTSSETMEEWPFAVDLFRWISGFLMTMALLMFLVNTSIGFSHGVLVDGLTAVSAALLRLSATALAVKARRQRVESLATQAGRRSLLERQHLETKALADELLEPLVDLRSNVTG